MYQLHITTQYRPHHTGVIEKFDEHTHTDARVHCAELVRFYRNNQFYVVRDGLNKFYACTFDGRTRTTIAIVWVAEAVVAVQPMQVAA